MAKWTKVASVADFDATDRKYIEVDEDLQVGLFKLEDGKFYAIEVWCSHQKVSLITGSVDGYEVLCPLHGARFDLRNGKALCLPAVRGVDSYPVKEEEGDLLIKV